MIENKETRLKISESAYHYLKGKNHFFAPRARFARIVLNGVTCSGARFSLFHDYVSDEDIRLQYRDLTLLVDRGLLERFEGFDLDLERFFLGTRILITPRVDDYNCDCEQKCK